MNPSRRVAAGIVLSALTDKNVYSVSWLSHHELNNGDGEGITNLIKYISYKVVIDMLMSGNGQWYIQRVMRLILSKILPTNGFVPQGSWRSAFIVSYIDLSSNSSVHNQIAVFKLWNLISHCLKWRPMYSVLPLMNDCLQSQYFIIM